MSDNEIRIYIETRIIDDGSGQTPIKSSEEQSAVLAKESSGGQSAAAVALIHLGKQAANTGLANYGNLTGDYQTERTIKNIISWASMGAMIVANPVIGTIAAVGQIGIKSAQIALDIYKADIVAERLRERTQIAAANKGR